MSEENELTVRGMFEALSARPEEIPAIGSEEQVAERVEKFVGEFWDADGDYYPVRKFPEARPCHGHEAITRFLIDYLEAWSYRYAINNLIGVGDDRVLVCATLHAEGRGSEVKLEGDIYHSVWLRHGLVFRQEDHLTLGGALHGLGLEGSSIDAAGLSE